MDDSNSSIRRIYLLGSVRIDDVPVTGEKAVALLAYLALNIQSLHAREVLIDLLWSDFPIDRARPALSDLLYRLRKSLGPACILADASRAGLNQANVWTDVSAFLDLTSVPDRAGLQQAVTLYTGPLAPEVYMDWIIPRRMMLQERYVSALEQLGDLAEAQQQIDIALGYYQQLVEAEPLREEAQRGVMRNLARLGRLTESLQTYARLETMFQSELAVAPSADTISLAEQIRAELRLQQASSDVQVRLPCVGRTVERSVALAKVESAMIGRGGALAIEGPAGIGKSRLWEEIAAGARWRGATVLSGRASEYPTGSPLELLCDLLDQALQGPRAAQVELLLPAEVLAAVGDLYPRWRDRAVLPELPLLQARQRWEQSLRKVVRTLTELAPHVIILDDLQWATSALWDAITAVVADASQQRLLIGLAYRRPDVEHSYGWPRLQQWERTAALEIASLAPLSASEVEAMLPESYRTYADTVAAVSAGNPFYITQALFALQENMPLLTAERIVLDRIASLPALEHDVLESAATIGPNLPLRLWSELTDLEPALLIAVADRLAIQHFLHPVAEGYAFAHDMIQETVYSHIEPVQRRLLHERAAQAWRRFDGGNVHALAFHLDHAGEVIEAASCYHTAGTQDMAAFAFAEARAAYERAIALWPSKPDSKRILTLFDIAQVCDSTGDRERQRSALNEALQDAQQLENDDYMLRALVGVGRLAAVTGDVNVAAKSLEDAVALAEQVPDGNLRFEAYFYSGDLEARRGRVDASRTRFEKALEQARSQPDPLNEARALRGLSIVARLSGDPIKAMDLIEQALALQVANGDLFGASVTQTNQLATLYDMGAWDRLVALAGEALRVKEQLGDQHGAAIMRHMRGLAAYSLGDLEQARLSLTAALQGFETVQDRRTAALARNVLGLVAEAAGDLTGAERDYEAALAAAEAVSAATEAAYARHDLGALLVRLNRLGEAIPLLEMAHDTWQEAGHDLLCLKSEAHLGLACIATDRQRAEALADKGWAAFQRGIPTGEMPQAWLWGLHQLLEKLNRAIEAGAVLQTAYAELQRQAAAIQDPRQRRHFFEWVSLNREIVTAYDRLTAITRQITRSLTRAEIPTGRHLTPDDFILVTWMLVAPEDDLIANPAERRRHILRRLLDEAAAQGAVPTDSDLAAVLDVSRRTILRDRQALSQLGQPIPTRRRK